ncbi:unnamed protein product, partial [Discosporangium mesarthrocarpum]
SERRTRGGKEQRSPKVIGKKKKRSLAKRWVYWEACVSWWLPRCGRRTCTRLSKLVLSSTAYDNKSSTKSRSVSLLEATDEEKYLATFLTKSGYVHNPRHVPVMKDSKGTGRYLARSGASKSRYACV